MCFTGVKQSFHGPRAWDPLQTPIIGIRHSWGIRGPGAGCCCGPLKSRSALIGINTNFDLNITSPLFKPLMNIVHPYRLFFTRFLYTNTCSLEERDHNNLHITLRRLISNSWAFMHTLRLLYYKSHTHIKLFSKYSVLIRDNSGETCQPVNL